MIIMDIKVRHSLTNNQKGIIIHDGHRNIMNAKYDTETIKLTPRFIKALEELMAAECEMMAKAEPENAECWTWGKCEVGDLCKQKGLDFTYGGDEDFEGGKRFRVLSANDEGRIGRD